MNRRRSAYDPLADRTHPHWLTVSDMSGTILEAEPIAARSDLHALWARTMDRLTADGWAIEGDGRYGNFFCHREGVRRFVHIQAANPELPKIGPSWHPSCPGCGE